MEAIEALTRTKIERRLWEAACCLADVKEIMEEDGTINEWVLYENNKEPIHEIISIGAMLVQKANESKMRSANVSELPPMEGEEACQKIQ
jgi:hypothetical protein|tara:strand:- start:92 stop:361 length:270 start_codon:yes stop_codon:yes gene_type:complete